MKRLVIVWAAIASFASHAVAADLPARFSKAPPALPAVANWTGCYLGGGFGYGTSNSGPSGARSDRPAGWHLKHEWRSRLGWDSPRRLRTISSKQHLQMTSWLSEPSGITIGPADKGIGVFSAAALVPGDVRGNENMSSAWAAGGRIGLGPGSAAATHGFRLGWLYPGPISIETIFYRLSPELRRAQFIKTERRKWPEQGKACGKGKQQRQHRIAEHRTRQHQSEHRIDHAQNDGVARHRLEILPAQPQRRVQVGQTDGPDDWRGRDFRRGRAEGVTLPGYDVAISLSPFWRRPARLAGCKRPSAETITIRPDAKTGNRGWPCRELNHKPTLNR